MEKIKGIQEQFFFRIKQAIPSYENLAQSVAIVLDISSNEAYKKIKGLSQLTMTQIIKLTDFYNVQFSYSPSLASSVTFNYDTIEAKPTMMQEHIDKIFQQVKSAKRAKKKRLTIVTEDIPFFYLFKYRELGLFKLAYWESSLHENSTPFVPDSYPETITNQLSQIYEAYLEIPTFEIWSKNALESTVDQIKYAVDAGIIKSVELGCLLLEQLKSVLTNIEQFSIKRKKTIDPDHFFEWYQCDVVGCVTFLLEVEHHRLCFQRFNTFNFLETSDAAFCDMTRKWIDRLVKKSTCFSGQAEKYRNKFLRIANKNLDDLIEKLPHGLPY